jgi:predicted Zn finger-like uncharacterized protein
MALATQCPHCHTTFRVVHDQLKLRGGLVRCGSCKQIFNGIEHLLRPDQVLQTPAQTTSPASAHTATPAKAFENDKTEIPPAADSNISSTSSIDFVPIEDHAEAYHSSTASPTTQSGSTEVTPDPNDPLQRMTLMDFTYAEDRDGSTAAEQTSESSAEDSNTNDAGADRLGEAESSVPDPLDQAIEDLQQKPWRSENTATPHDRADDMVAAESDEPAFVTQGRRRQRRSRMLRTTLWIASVLLCFSLVGQGAYIFRNQLAASLPQLKPMLVNACSLLDCQVTLPSKIDAVSIESSELQAVAPQKDTFALTILLRNYSATAQAWPNIELTLSDSNEKVLVRRIFTPGEYLPAKQEIGKGLASNSEQPVKILFELLQLKASGYRVYLYYP